MLEFKLSSSPELSSPDLKVGLCCKTSGRAALAACALHDMGYLHVKSISGGFDAWVAAGKPVIKPSLPVFEQASLSEMITVPTPTIHSFFDPATFTVSHVVSDRVTSRAAVIDSVLDYDPKSGRTSHASADRLIDYLTAQSLQLDWLLETHAHADHLSASAYLKEKLGGKVAIGRPICEVQTVFRKIFNDIAQDCTGADFDHLLDDGEMLRIGDLEVRVMQTPGHTPACLTFVIGADAFIGDTLFMPDCGSARCDFPGGDAATLYRSIRKILALPANTRLHLCHDYPPAGREPAWVTSVDKQREKNIHVHDGIDEAGFVGMREAHDHILAMPVLILPAVQVNIRAGKLPAPEDNGVSYLKIPVNFL